MLHSQNRNKLKHGSCEASPIIKRIYEDPRNGFGSIADTLRQARQQDPAITRSDVVQFMETVKTREDRPQRGYNSFVPTEPMHQLQVDLADMSVFSAKPILQGVRPRRSAHCPIT